MKTKLPNKDNGKFSNVERATVKLKIIKAVRVHVCVWVHVCHRCQNHGELHPVLFAPEHLNLLAELLAKLAHTWSCSYIFWHQRILTCLINDSSCLTRKVKPNQQNTKLRMHGRSSGSIDCVCIQITFMLTFKLHLVSLRSLVQDILENCLALSFILNL